MSARKCFNKPDNDQSSDIGQPSGKRSKNQ